jgi:nucleoside-diphosphate-sugar epimerase
VTGAADGLGNAAARALLADPRIGKVIAVDDRRGLLPGATWRVADVRDPALAGRLAKVDVVVHLDLDLGVERADEGTATLNVRGTQTVLTAAAAVGVRRVVLCTSAMVYGASPDNPVPLDEDAPLRAVPDGSLVSDLLEIEDLVGRSRSTHPGLEVTVLRPAAVVGPDIDSVITRHFEAPRLLMVRGSSPRWQFCHVDDLAAAVVPAALGEVTGAVTVGCEGWLEQEEVEHLTGLRRIELPASLALGTAERLHRLGLIPAPASDLQYVMHPWVIPSTRLRETGHHAVGARRVGRRDATIGAAGAAVAVVGTAALVRRARKKRRG